MATYDARKSKPLLKALSTLGDTTSISGFLDSVQELTSSEKEIVVEQAIILIDQLYAHLPLKESRHAIRPVQQLRLLRARASELSDSSFHREMLEVFKGLRDAHTNYGLPKPYSDSIAFLPFLLEEYVEDGERKYLVSRTIFNFQHQKFKSGVEITHWNGTNMERAVRLNADREEGSNDAARYAFGLANMTVRSLGSSLPPEEEWVTVSFLSGSQTHEIILPWRVWNTASEPRPNLGAIVDGHAASSQTAGSDSICNRVAELHLARKMLFAPEAVSAEKRIENACGNLRKKLSQGANLNLDSVSGDDVDLTVESILPEIIQFSVFQNFGKEFGYIRIRRFDHSPVEQFINEIVRVVEMMPRDGLIIDVRGNGGGIILNGERMLQLFTPHPIQPEPFQFINTPLTEELCSPAPVGSHPTVKDFRKDLDEKWGDSIRQSLETGAVYSKGVVLTPVDEANNIGQIYHGPVVLITDAQCYSTTDIFAAGFKDHEIGEIIGVDANTGAGGANVWRHGSLLVPLLNGSDSSIEPLPGGVSMRVSIRRCTRVKENAGQPLEDLGVKPHIIHDMTKDDLMSGNIDLITLATERLNDQPVRQLDIRSIDATGATLDLELTTLALDRVDCYLDGRPLLSKQVRDGDNSLSIAISGPPNRLELKGFNEGVFVAARKAAL